MKHLRSGKSGLHSIQGVYVAFAANRDVCHSFLRRCAEYGEKLLALSRRFTIASPTSARVGTPYKLPERTMRLRSKMTGVSTEYYPNVQGLSAYHLTSFDGYHWQKWAGSRKFKAVYKKALSLEQNTTSGLNSLVEKLSSWVTITCSDGLRDDVPSDIIILEQHRELWVEARDSVRAMLAILENKPASQMLHNSAPPLRSTNPLSVMKRWLMNLVCFSWYHCFSRYHLCYTTTALWDNAFFCKLSLNNTLGRELLLKLLAFSTTY